MSKRMTLVAAGLALAAGCGESGPKLVPVSGTVTLNGKPLEGATVSFSPDPSNKEGQGAEDVTGPAGNYKAMTRGRSGVAPGKYKVTVLKTPAAATTGVSDQFRDDPFMAQLSAEGPEVGKTAKKAVKVEGVFDRDVPPEGGVVDFDVKAGAAAAAVGAAPKDAAPAK